MSVVTLPLGDATDLGREAIAAEIRALMGRRRVSQSKLARHLGLTQQALSRRLVGKVPFDTDELFRMLTYLGVGKLEIRSDYTAMMWGTTPDSGPGAAEQDGQQSRWSVHTPMTLPTAA